MYIVFVNVSHSSEVYQAARATLVIFGKHFLQIIYTDIEEMLYTLPLT